MMADNSFYHVPDLHSYETNHEAVNAEMPDVRSLPDILSDLKTGEGSAATTAVGQLTEIVDSGTQCDVQMLYEGPPQCRCCINWVEEYPKNLKSCIEQEAETKKKALIVRMAKNHQEGRQLALDSIVVQNQQIKDLLSEVFQGYQGITPNLKKLVLKAPFHPFFYRWDVFKTLVAEQKTNGTEAAPFSHLLYRILDLETKDTRDEIEDLQSQGVITYQLLWALFHPGMQIYASMNGHDRIYLMESSQYQDNPWGSGLSLTLKSVDWDGKQFGFATEHILVSEFSGTRKINELNAYPLVYHESKSDVMDALKHRGEKFFSLNGVHHKAYSGDLLRKDQQNTVLKIDARVIIDASAAPHNLLVRGLTPLELPPVASNVDFGDRVHMAPMHGQSHAGMMPMHGQSHAGMMPMHGQSHAGMMPMPSGRRGAQPGGPVSQPPAMMMPGMRRSGTVNSEEDEFYSWGKPPNLDIQQVSLSERDLMLCNSHITAYSLKDKVWGKITVDDVKDVKWNDGAFPSLILPEGHKELILAFVEGQLAYEDEFDDVIHGKGKGLTMLLVGAPGTGKTLTGEAIADKVRQPLYMLSAAELGQEADQVEDKLHSVLRLTNKWKAVLLLDECDVFLEKRSQNNLNHNEVVAVFLRLLEYYPGMLFLTTNRGDAIDLAFQSRIHLTLQYPDLEPQARKQIWQQFCSRSRLESSLTSEDMESLSGLPLNGRQIKNIIKISSLLARREGGSLQLGHVETVLKATGQMRRGE